MTSTRQRALGLPVLSPSSKASQSPAQKSRRRYSGAEHAGEGSGTAATIAATRDTAAAMRKRRGRFTRESLADGSTIRTRTRTGARTRVCADQDGAARAAVTQPLPAQPQPVEVEVDDRRREERQHLREDQPADDRDAQRAAQLAAGPEADRERQAAQERGHGGHGDRPEAQHAGLEDRVLRAAVSLALCGDGEVD